MRTRRCTTTTATSPRPSIAAAASTRPRSSGRCRAPRRFYEFQETDVFPIQSLGSYAKSKQPAEYFCKNLTASDRSTHGGFSVLRRAAEKLFPQLDYSMQPPNQEAYRANAA
ncbi:hypothetical protein ZWY2020_052556 [Hordeum vulgare]|nr:hypothetical protein ZWY2020_052556 [Hordeum vulgare]